MYAFLMVRNVIYVVVQVVRYVTQIGLKVVFFGVFCTKFLLKCHNLVLCFIFFNF